MAFHFIHDLKLALIVGAHEPRAPVVSVRIVGIQLYAPGPFVTRNFPTLPQVGSCSPSQLTKTCGCGCREIVRKVSCRWIIEIIVGHLVTFQTSAEAAAPVIRSSTTVSSHQDLRIRFGFGMYIYILEVTWLEVALEVLTIFPRIAGSASLCKVAARYSQQSVQNVPICRQRRDTRRVDSLGLSTTSCCVP